jgi:hypothetical protein
MARKIALNLYVDPDMAKRLRATAEHYDNRLGDCLSAAIFLFLSATPQEQAVALQKVYAAALTNSVRSMLDEMRAEQTKRALATATDTDLPPKHQQTGAGKQGRKLPGANDPPPL